MRSAIGVLTAHDDDRDTGGYAWNSVEEVTGILSDVDNMTPVPSLAPFDTIHRHDRGTPGDEHLLDLYRASELGRDVHRVHIVLARE